MLRRAKETFTERSKSMPIRTKRERDQALERLHAYLKSQKEIEDADKLFSLVFVALMFAAFAVFVLVFAGCGTHSVDASRPLAVAQQLHYEGCMDTEVLPPKLCLSAYRELRAIEADMERHDTEHKLMSVQIKAGVERALKELANQLIHILPTGPNPPIKPTLERI